MSEYIYPCENQGDCRKLMFQSMELTWSDSYPKNGVIQVVTSKEPHNIPQWRGKYKCCTQCHLPINLAEAAKANKLLGYKLEDVKPDNDFLGLLDGF